MPEVKDDKIRLKAAAFLNSRKNANNLVDIVSILDKNNEKQLRKCLLALDTIFTAVFQRNLMVKKDDQTSAEKQYRIWLQDIYKNTFTKLIALFLTSENDLQSKTLDLLMKLIIYEERNPLRLPTDGGTKSKHKFPISRLGEILTALVSSEKNTKPQINKFAVYAKYRDVTFHAWQLMPPFAAVSTPNELYALNFIRLASTLIIPKGTASQGKLFLCKGGAKYIPNDNEPESKLVENIWKLVTKWKLVPTTHKLLMVVLINKVLPHLQAPLYLSDYLIETFHQVGALSVLALQALLTLMQKFNFEYPNIYAKLYLMMNPEIFQLKYKKRLFYLTDMFLTSSHLPQTLVAAFVKRLSRLTLVAPAHDIQILLAFIGNLLIRHSGLKKLLVGSHQDPEKVCDPYDMNEINPKKCKAMESFLWEIHSLKQHYLPGVANTAKEMINNPLPSVEWDFGVLLEGSQDQLFDRELKKRPQEITLTYDKPQTMQLREGERLLQFWTLA